jgi:hypothetical protein
MRGACCTILVFFWKINQLLFVKNKLIFLLLCLNICAMEDKRNDSNEPCLSQIIPRTRKWHLIYAGGTVALAFILIYLIHFKKQKPISVASAIDGKRKRNGNLGSAADASANVNFDHAIAAANNQKYVWCDSSNVEHTWVGNLDILDVD